MSNYYLALGIEKNADLNKIKKAYRICCKKYHPDMQHDKEKKQEFLKIQKAYEVLSDEEKRKCYDQSLENRKQHSHQYKNTPVHQHMFRDNKTFWNRNIKKFSTLIDDFFEGFVPGFFEDEFSQQKDLYLELILSPHEAAMGGDFSIDVPVIEECPVCFGSGYWGAFICSNCSGFGQVRSHRAFVLHVPAHVKHGAEARVSLEGIGLKRVFLNVEIIIQNE